MPMTRPARPARFPSLSFVLALALVCTACEKKPAATDPPRTVLTQIVGAAQESEPLAYSGEVRSRYETPLSFRIPGKISARLVDAGAVVRPGDVLARLDPADTALAAAAASAQLELASAEVQRFRSLRERNFVSQAALEARETTFKAARAQADLARNQAAYATLRAEQAGVVGLISAEVGQVVTAGQTVLRIARADTLEVAIAVPEAHMPLVRSLRQAEIGLWAEPAARYRGELREISPVADPVTRTYAARVAIRQPDARVLLGMTASVRFQRANEKPVLSVPLTAIFQQADGQPALWVVQADRTLSLRPIVVRAYREDLAIIGEGVQAGERVVVAGVHKVSRGEPVRAIDQPSGNVVSADPSAANR